MERKERREERGEGKRRGEEGLNLIYLKVDNMGERDEEKRRGEEDRRNICHLLVALASISPIQVLCVHVTYWKGRLII